MAQSKSKLGKNPFEKKSQSRVGRMIEATFDSSSQREELQKVQSPNFFNRVHEMKLSMNLKEFIRSIRDLSST